MVTVYLVYDSKKYGNKSAYENLVSEPSLKALKDLEPRINYIPYSVNGSEQLSEGILKVKQQNPHAKIAVLARADTARVQEEMPKEVQELSRNGLVDFFIFAQDKQSANPIMQPEWASDMLQILHREGGFHEGEGKSLSERIIDKTHKRIFKKLLEGSQPSSASQSEASIPANTSSAPGSDLKSQTPQSKPGPFQNNAAMRIIFGFMAVLGALAVTLAFVLLGAATANPIGLSFAILGGALALGSMGLFAYSFRKNNAQQTPQQEALASNSICLQP